ncbi:WD40-repeat-containing domain protein [Blastocladiella britannica]|nr:WD40-repeat-containing domain protein [Blastocladiella britannica]
MNIQLSNHPTATDYAPGAITAAVSVLPNPQGWPELEFTLQAPSVAVRVRRAAQEGVPDLDERALRSKPNAINALDFSPAGDVLAVGGDAGTIRLLSTADGAVLRTLTGHVGDISCMRFFPSGQVLMTAANDLTARIWSTLDGSCPRTLKGHSRVITDCAMIGRGKSVLTTSRDCTARLWLCSTAECTTVFDLEHPVQAVSLLEMARYAPDRFPSWHDYSTDEERYLGVFALESGSIVGVHLSTHDIEFRLPYTHPANTLTVLNARYLAAGYENGVMIVWDMQLQRPAVTAQVFKTPVTQVKLLSATGTPGFVVVVTSADGLAQTVSVTVPTSGSDGNDGTAQIQTILTGCDMEPLYAVAVVPGQRTVATAGRDGVVRVYK